MLLSFLHSKPSDHPTEAIPGAQAADAVAVLDALGRSQALIEFTPNGHILNANENFLAALGYTLEEIKGSHHRRFMPRGEADTDQYAAFWRSLGAGEFAAGEFKRVTKTGEEIWISASYNPVFDENGAVSKVVKIASDITATKTSALEQLAVLDALGRSQAYIAFTPEGVILDANENFLGALGYTLDEIRGQHHRIFCDAQHVNSPEYTAFWSNLKAGKFSAGRYLRVAKGGRKIWIQATYNPVFDSDGRVERVVKFATDITEQVEAEQQTKIEAASVGQTVASSSTEMASTIEEISKNVGRTANLAQQAEDHARGSKEAAEKLEGSSQEIGKVVGVIQELADQTNLLALNATIEAARAGESGRSFAVVAGEVKELAQETSKATQSIESIINEIQTRIAEVNQSTEQITGSISEVSGNTNTVAAAIEEQSITMSELSRTAEGLVKLAEEAAD